MTLQDIARNTGNAIKDHSPAILTALGVTGVVGTAVLAAKVSPEAHRRVWEEEFAGDNLPINRVTPWEKVKITWKLYIPAVTVGAATIACIVASHSISTRRNAAAVAALGFTEMAYREYREKAVEMNGRTKDQKVVDEIASDHVKNNPPSDTLLMLDSGTKTVVLERMGGRYFVSDMETIRKAQNDINEIILTSDYALLNDFYERVGLDRTQLGDEMGWNHENTLEIEYTSLLHEGKPIMVIAYRNNPVPNPFRIWG